MRHVLLACLAFGAMTSAALAQDGFTYSGGGSGAGVAGATGFDWSGPYVGVQAGGGWLQSSLQATPSGFANSYNGSGWLGGATAGYNIQATSNVIVGVEAEANISSTAGNDAGVGGSTDSTKIKWDGTLNGRVGTPFGPTLAYLTGGLALAGATQTNSGGAISNPGTLVGWNLGGGLDVALTDKLFGRIGAKYKSYGTASFAGPSVPTFTGKTTSQEVTIGIGMKLK